MAVRDVVREPLTPKRQAELRKARKDLVASLSELRAKAGELGLYAAMHSVEDAARKAAEEIQLLDPSG